MVGGHFPGIQAPQAMPAKYIAVRFLFWSAAAELPLW